MLEQLDASLISSFLEHLETVRGNSAETRNIRLAAIRSFFRFLQHNEPSAVGQVRRVSAIPSRKPTIVWCRIWPTKKCRPCSMLLIHPREWEFETEPYCT
jgi:hypothetical protein